MNTLRKQRGVRSAPGPLELTSRDVAALKLLTRYRYLRTPFITGFLGGSHAHMATRLRRLFDHELVLRARPHLRIGNLNSHPEIYEIAPKGTELLKTLGQHNPFDGVNARPGKTRKHEFFHDTYICDILASIELGVRETPGLTFLSFYDILSGAPKEAQEAPYPLSVWVDRSKNRHVTPDALFGVEYLDGKKAYFALEADRDTETIGIYAHKMRNYLDHFKMFYRHFGIGNFRVLTVTVNETHMRNLLKKVPNPKMFLFKTLPSYSDLTRPPQPTPAVFTTPWNRLNLEPESISGLASEARGASRPAKAA